MNPESATAAVDGVVLLHGWGGSADSDWEVNGWCRSLARRGRTPLAVDLPGHGHRPQSHDPGDYADLASEIMAALPDGGRLDGIGFSLGAKVLLEIAARHPHRFRRLVAGGLGGNVFAPEPLGHELAGVLETGDGAEAPAAVRELAQYGVGNGNDPLAMAAVLRRAANPLLTPDRLTRVRCPVLLSPGRTTRWRVRCRHLPTHCPTRGCGYSPVSPTWTCPRQLSSSGWRWRFSVRKAPISMTR